MKYLLLPLLSSFCLLSCTSYVQDVEGVFMFDEPISKNNKVLIIKPDHTFSLFGIKENPKNVDSKYWVEYHYWNTKGNWLKENERIKLFLGEDYPENKIRFEESEIQYLNNIKPYLNEDLSFSLKDSFVYFNIEKDYLIEVSEDERFNYVGKELN